MGQSRKRIHIVPPTDKRVFFYDPVEKLFYKISRIQDPIGKDDICQIDTFSRTDIVAGKIKHVVCGDQDFATLELYGYRRADVSTLLVPDLAALNVNNQTDFANIRIMAHGGERHEWYPHHSGSSCRTNNKEEADAIVLNILRVISDELKEMPVREPRRRRAAPQRIVRV
ncbi:MAG: hypothetical protein AB7G06_03535 [Bdellovibrionales bacterium]